MAYNLGEIWNLMFVAWQIPLKTSGIVTNYAHAKDYA